MAPGPDQDFWQFTTAAQADGLVQRCVSQLQLQWITTRTDSLAPGSGCLAKAVDQQLWAAA